MNETGRLRVALLVLRLGLGVFLALWSVDKLVQSQGTVHIFSHFYGLHIPATAARVIGVAELLLSAAFLAGWWKTGTYGLALLLHTVSTLSTYRELLSPFGRNHLFIAGVPVLAAFVALFVLRREDTLLSLDRRPPPDPAHSDHI